MSVFQRFQPEASFIMVDQTEVARVVQEQTPHLVVCSELNTDIETYARGWVVLPADGQSAAVMNTTGEVSLVANLDLAALLDVIAQVHHRVAANFGFISKYQKGATVPTGQTEFQFKTGSLNFQSESYEWLVVGGAKAQYKGTGTINGTGSYGFILTAIDGQIRGGGGADKFRIKITDKGSGAVVYDNQLGAADDASPTTVLSGGSIVIHSK